jgi:hypothetical protein
MFMFAISLCFLKIWIKTLSFFSFLLGGADPAL